jgi:hypothetical protein
MAQFKGSIFESTRVFTEKEFGSNATARVLAELSPADQTALAGVSVLGWYPVEPVLHYHHALDRLYGNGDLSACYRAGRFSAGWAFNNVLKFMLRFTTPMVLIERATSVWERYHDSGRWEVETQGKQRFVGKLHEFQVHDPAFCARLRGWVHGAVELTGGKKVSVIESRCVCRGHDHCAFLATWQ